MKLYILDILQNNSIDEVFKLKDLFDEYKDKFLLQEVAPEEAYTILVSLVFEKREDREELADKIPHIAFKYDDIEVDEDFYKQVKESAKSLEESEADIICQGRPKKYKPTKYELKIDAFLERKEIKFDKKYADYIVYIFEIKKLRCMLFLDYKGKTFQGAIEKGNMIICQQKSFMDDAIAKMMNEIEKLMK